MYVQKDSSVWAQEIMHSGAASMFLFLEFRLGCESRSAGGLHRLVVVTMGTSRNTSAGGRGVVSGYATEEPRK